MDLVNFVLVSTLVRHSPFFFSLENLCNLSSLLSAGKTSFWVLHPDLNTAVQE